MRVTKDPPSGTLDFSIEPIAWLNIHRTRQSFLLFAVALLLYVLFSAVVLEQIGFVVLAAPVAATTLIPLLTASAIALGTSADHRLAVFAPIRLRVLSAFWAGGLTALGLALTAVGQAMGSATTLAVSVRNVLFFASLALVMVDVARATLVWLPGLTWTMTGLVFAHDEGSEGFMWWAFFLRQTTSALQVSATAVVFAGAVLVFACSRLGTVAPALGRRR